ncbi:EamA family transporter [Chondrinema litorale]|uniref:EamA family transporter n=1 Tax=Chondrinema litorale TaxID=2994555 RepID=UPI002543370A|nr:EamA family transporter [Chondrinema litorale]UZR98436.1 EamA family transporter [Chondrinema litorale]
MNWSYQIPPHLYFVASAIFHYLGPSFAVLLFTRVSVDGVAWLRILSAAIIFAIWRRPWNTFMHVNIKVRYLIIALGVTFALMNYSFYYAIDKLPLGTVAAIEFIGPVLLALTGTKTFRNLFALALTTTGVWFLTDARIEGELEGFFWAFVNAICFIVYIILAHRLSSIDAQTKSVDRLGASVIFAAVMITPLGIEGALPAFTNTVAILAGIGVGISSSVIPYVLDQLAMSKLSRATYSLFVALLPATAVIIGIIVLKQIPTSVEIAAVTAIISGVLISQDKKQDNK